MNKRFFLIICIFVLLVSMSACGYIDQIYTQKPTDTAQELFSAGTSSMQDKDYATAITYFSKLQDQFPFSKMSAVGLLSLGDAYFLNKQYQDASNTYREFESLHPKHEAIPYVLFQVGMSEYKQFKTIDLPQEHSAMAMDYFKKLVESYPDSNYAQQAQGMLVACRLNEAKHEVFVADFYWRDGKFSAAANRYKYIVENFKDIKEISDYAEQRYYIAYIKAQKIEAQINLDKLNNKTKWNWL